MLNTFRLQAYQMLKSGWFSLFIVVLILLNIPLSILSSAMALTPLDIAAINKTDTFITIVFTIEYLIRLWTAPLDPAFKSNRFLFALRPAMLIDLLAVIPIAYLNFPLLRTFRMLRLFRILKILQYSTSVKLIFSVINRKMDSLLSITFLIGFLLTLSSFLIYYFEHAAQPQNFASIYDAAWYCIMIVTTIGSNLEVVTTVGKLVTIATSFSGIVLIAIYAGIFSAGFTEENAAKKEDLAQQSRNC